MSIQGITEHDIANYLANTPGFFERNAELLSSVQLTSPHGQRAVSLQERQMEMLREKLKGLEQKIIEMIRHGQDNVAISDRLHRFTELLMLTPNAADMPSLVEQALMGQFLVPQAALRVWGGAAAFSSMTFAKGVSDDAKLLASSLTAPYCGMNSGFEPVTWLDDPAAAMSIALIPLRLRAKTQAFGLLVLASPDPTRFSADLGIDFLVRIGEIASAALSRLLDPQ